MSISRTVITLLTQVKDLKSKTKLEGKDQLIIFIISFSKSHCTFLSENLFAEKCKKIVSNVLPTSDLTATFNSQMKLEIKHYN